MDVLLLGLDGVCRPTLDPPLESGATPTLADLLDRGASGSLTSQLPPWTPSAWPSLYTGVNPGKHGVYGFLRFDGYDWDVVNHSDVRARSLWELLDHHGMTSVAVNVPVTDPPRPVDGAVIPGYVGRDPPDCHPDGILDEVEAAVGEYSVYSPLDRGEDDVAGAADLARRRGEAFRYLVDRFDPEFGFLEFQATDTVFHTNPGDEEAVREIFGAVDDAVTGVLEDCDPDAVFVVSDHGMGEYRGHDVRVNETLRDEGLVTATPEGDGMPSWDAIARNRLQEGEDGDDGGAPDPGLAGRAAKLAARVGLTSQRIEAVLEPLGLAEPVAEIAPTDAVRAGTEQVDFRESRAYLRSRIELGVRINLEGREPEGVVAQEEYDAVRSDVMEALSELRTPAGEPVFEMVCPREDVFDGPHLEDAPDVVAVPDDFEHTLNGSLLGETFDEPLEPYNHKRDGLIVAAGDGVDESASMAGAHLFDVAPTVLSALGVPRSDRMDGEVLPVVDPSPVESYPELGEEERQSTDDADVEERLANLGYID